MCMAGKLAVLEVLKKSFDRGKDLCKFVGFFLLKEIGLLDVLASKKYSYNNHK